MTIENWRTGSSVQKGELTLDPQEARRKLRDYRLADPHRWLLEIVAAANLGGASEVSVEVDSDEVMIVISGVLLSENDIETLWQAPFQKLSNPVTRHIALGLISAESLEPTRILLRSGNVEANLGEASNRSLLEKITTQLFPEDPATNSIQIYVRIPLKFSRLFISETLLPEFVYLKTLAKYSKTPVKLRGKDVTDPNFVSLGNQSNNFDANGLEGSLNLTFDVLRVTFVRDGVITETIETDAHIPADIVVRTERLNYDLSGTQVIRDEAYDRTMFDLIQITRQVFLRRMEDRSLASSFDHIKTRLFVVLLTEFVHNRTFFEETPAVDLALAHALRGHRMWACAGTSPLGAPSAPTFGRLVSLNDAMPNGNHLHRSPVKLAAEFGDRAVLMTGRDTNYATIYESVPRPLVEKYLEATSEDISSQVQASQRRITAEARWRQNPIKTPLIERVEPNTFVSSKDTLVQIGHVQAPLTSEIVFTYKGNILIQVSLIPGVRVLIQNVNPNQHFDGIADDERAAELAKQFTGVYLEFLGRLAKSRPISALFAREPYAELHRLATLYIKDKLQAELIHFGQNASESVEIHPSDFADVPIFSTLTREAELFALSKNLLSLVTGGAFLEKATPLLSLRQILSSGKNLAVCNADEAERLILANYSELDPDTVVVVGDQLTEDLLGRITNSRPMHAASRHRELIGKADFIAKERIEFALPSLDQFALTTDLEKSTGRYLAGLSRGPIKQIEVRYLLDGRLVELVRLDSRAGAFVVVCHDTRLTVSSSYKGFLLNDARLEVESDIKDICAELALKYIEDNSTPVLDSLAVPLYSQLLFSGHQGAQALAVLGDLNGERHSLMAAREWPQIQFVRHGHPAAPNMMIKGVPVLVVPSSFPENALPNSKDVSDSPELRQQRRAAKDRFLGSKVEPIELNRDFSANAAPEGPFGLAKAKFITNTITGVVGLVGLKRHMVRVTVLHQKRHVGTHTLTLPFGEFEAVVDIDDIELDALYTEIKEGANLADKLIKEHCGKCLLKWLQNNDCHPDSIRAVRGGGTSLGGWSLDHVRAATNLTLPKANHAPEEVAAPAPKVLGPEHACFRFLEEIRGDSGVFANVAVRGIELKELGTGLPSQAEGNIIQVDPTHPTNRLALSTDDPVWRAMLVSSAFTSLNLRWLAITDDHEEEFHTRMLDYMAKALRPTE